VIESSILADEIRAQPIALERLLTTQLGTARELSGLLSGEDVRFVLIAARGSSSNAARYAQYILGRAHRVPVALATPSLYTVYGQPPRLDGALVVGISQSGESPDVVAVLEEASRQGRPSIALTNSPESPLARAADGVLPLEAGVELAVAATKTYSNSIAAIALLFCALTDDEKALAELRAMPDRVAEQIELSFMENAALPLEGFAAATVIGRGVNYSTAREVALKIRELSGLFVEAYSTAELLHGPVAALTAGSPVIGVAPPGPAFANVAETLYEARRRGAVATAIAEPGLEGLDGILPLVADVPEWLSPLTAVVPGQVAGMRIGAALGRDVDRPAGLQKVTLTR
jgi:glucosamine--fructose-6-phosphate aminotransferase (isomerizing)